jgi:hypothetical protein
MRVLAVLAVVFMCVSWAASAAAQTTDIEILSKADARKIFAMSRQQWDRNVTALVATGAAVRTIPAASGLVGMLMTTPDTAVITRLDYSKGDAKPTFAQMAFSLPPAWSESFTDAMARETIADFQRLLAPEFAVDGRMERLRAGPTFFFIITEREPRAGGEAAKQMEMVREE